MSEEGRDRIAAQRLGREGGADQGLCLPDLRGLFRRRLPKGATDAPATAHIAVGSALVGTCDYSHNGARLQFKRFLEPPPDESVIVLQVGAARD